MTAPPSDEQLQRLLNQAVGHHRAGRLAQAALLYREFLDHRPGHGGVLHVLGMVYFQQGRPQAAVGLIEQALVAEPEEPDFHCNLGNARRAAGDLEGALAAYRQALRIAPDFVDAGVNLGNALQTLGRYEEAIASYRAVRQAAPERADLHSNLGVALKNTGRFDDAVDCYRRALELKPDYLDAQLNLAGALRELERWPECQAAYRRALELEPDNDLSLRRLIEVCDRGGDYGAALEAVQTRLRRAPERPQLYNDLAVLLLKLRRYDDALTALGKALALQPDFAEAQFNRGKALDKQGHDCDAEAAYQAALELAPQYGPAYEALGRLCYSRGETDRAAEVFRRWLAVEPGQAVAVHMLAACGGETPPPRASDGYVQRHFDDFAQSYDEQLARLGYAGPALVEQALALSYPAPGADLRVLDAGCGTGLIGPSLKPYARRLTGVDLAPNMLRLAHRLALYDQLIEAELSEFLAARTDAYDLMVSADTLVYFGDLEPLFRAAAGALSAGGRLLFSVERTQGDGYRLHPSGRYRHSEAYLRQALAGAGFALDECRPVTLRQEAGREIAGFFCRCRLAEDRARDAR